MNNKKDGNLIKDADISQNIIEVEHILSNLTN